MPTKTTVGPMRVSAVVCALLPCWLGACIERSNPCDPDADEKVQSEGTRIRGRVVDQDGGGVAGVTVSISGRAETVVSGEGGVFELTDVPPSMSYELVALPQAPLVGGRVTTPALFCGGVLDDIELGVVVPLDAPAVEIVRASGEARIFAAFGSGSSAAPADVGAFFMEGDNATPRRAVDVAEGCRAQAAGAAVVYRAQVREPFGAWQDAVLAPFPWVNPLSAARAAVDPADLHVDRVEDVCAAALCGQFEYMEPTLRHPNARCVEVVGTIDSNGEIVPLESFASYHVRILSELQTEKRFRERFALPERVVADPSPEEGQTTLLPASLLPVVGRAGTVVAPDISGIVVTAGRRFTLLENGALTVMGDGADTLTEGAQQTVGAVEGAPQEALGEDAATTDGMMSDFTAEAVTPVEPLGLLPAGAWVRTLRRAVDGSATIAKLYVGIDAADGASGPSPSELADNASEPQLRLDPAAEAATGPRAFFALRADRGSLADANATPADAYVILYDSAFVIVEEGKPEELQLGYFLLARDLFDGGVLYSSWAAPLSDAGGTLGGACTRMATQDKGASGVTILDDGRANVSVCYELDRGLAQAVDLHDVRFIPGADSYAMSDAANDRLLLTSRAALTCEGCTLEEARPLAAQITEVAVGVEPMGMLETHLLTCPESTSTRRPVLLVANHGSVDLSVIDVRSELLRETGVVAMPAKPVGFLEDPAGPSCDNPFVWVLADDGRVIPVDMRGEPSVPLCEGTACVIGTRGRATVGAVARSPGPGSSRALVGGKGLLGELGFFRPQALRNAAYQNPNDLLGGSSTP